MSETALLLRPAVRADIVRIVAMLADDVLGAAREDTSPEGLVLYEAAFERIAATNGAVRLFVAERDGETVGCFLLSLTPGLSQKGMVRAIIEEVRIDAAHRGRGLGAAMIRLAIEEARKSGASLVQLTSNKQRRDAHRFYEQLGFERSHEGFKLKL